MIFGRPMRPGGPRACGCGFGPRGEANRMSDVPPPILSVLLDAVRLIEVKMPEVHGLPR